MLSSLKKCATSPVPCPRAAPREETGKWPERISKVCPEQGSRDDTPALRLNDASVRPRGDTHLQVSSSLSVLPDMAHLTPPPRHLKHPAVSSHSLILNYRGDRPAFIEHSTFRNGIDNTPTKYQWNNRSWNTKLPFLGLDGFHWFQNQT